MRRLILVLILALVLPAAGMAQSGSYLWDVYLARDPIFLARVERAIVASAVAVRAEGSAVPNHAQRSQLAGQVLAYPETWARNLAVGFVTQPGITGTASCSFNADGSLQTCTTTATDATLKTVSDSLWNDYAVL